MHYFFYNKFISSLYMFRGHVLNVRRAKLCYTVSGIITPIGGRPVHRLCTGRPSYRKYTLEIQYDRNAD